MITTGASSGRGAHDGRPLYRRCEAAGGGAAGRPHRRDAPPQRLDFGDDLAPSDVPG
jgi:hypothetical protein